MSEVALIRCESYDYREVKSAVERGLELLGGAQRYVRAGEKVLLKPNLLAAAAPEECVTTHPSVFRAVAESLQSVGASLTYGDSPAIGSLEKVARRSGIQDAAEALGIKLADFQHGRVVSFPGGLQNKQFTIAEAVLASDGLVSLPKFKTHGLTTLTGAVKNQFGCIPGFIKGEFHVKLQDVSLFSRMLVDLNRCLKPRLFVVDAITAMEGNGPRNGKPRQMNALLLSADPVALDATASRLIGVAPESIPTTRAGQQMGLGTFKLEDIRLLGDDPDRLMVSGFNVGRKNSMMDFKNRRIRHMLVPRPQIDPERCVKCGICVNMCPVKPAVVDWNGEDHSQPPVYDYDRCIRCYCCQEVCPENAISLHTPWLGRAAGRFIKA
ncbi:MAG: DUF362 domain-containing protein [Firmicutes bacterium]|nr:DUF362 domain-containing protein [Bacillota bacterium]